VALLAVVLISVLIWVITIRPGAAVPQNSRVVEDVVDMSWDRASEKLVGRIFGEARRPERQCDRLRQRHPHRPRRGYHRSGQTITVYVSTGQQTSAMPDITGKSSTDAEAALKAVGLQLRAVTTRSDPDLAQGIVSRPTRPRARRSRSERA
jgi:serine/threonine-protein kinase